MVAGQRRGPRVRQLLKCSSAQNASSSRVAQLATMPPSASLVPPISTGGKSAGMASWARERVRENNLDSAKWNSAPQASVQQIPALWHLGYCCRAVRSEGVYSRPRYRRALGREARQDHQPTAS